MIGNYWKKYYLFTLLWIFELFSFGLHNQVNAQTNNEWTEINAIKIPNNTTNWFVDAQQNMYFICKEQIKKVSLNNVSASQSIKELQSIDQLIAINGLKIMLFSSEQQSICFTDNTLTLNGECIRLDEIGILNATCIAISKRPDLVWIYDEINSTLYLYNYVRKQFLQSVSNLKGLLSVEGTINIHETQFSLWLLTDNGSAVILDDYMNSIRNVKVSGSLFTPIEQDIYFTRNNFLIKMNEFSEEIVVLTIEKDEKISQIREVAGTLYLEFNNRIHIFTRAE